MLDSEDVPIIATHEAGHALVGHAFGCMPRWLIVDGRYGGLTDGGGAMPDPQQMAVLAAGDVAVDFLRMLVSAGVIGRPRTPSMEWLAPVPIASDPRGQRDVARVMATFVVEHPDDSGVRDDDVRLSAIAGHLGERSIQQWREWARWRAALIVRRNWRAMLRLADALIKEQTLDGTAIARILADVPQRKDGHAVSENVK